MEEYNKRLVEVDVVLNHLSEEDYKKIPEEILQAIKENKDKEYIWEYDETKELKDQGLSRDTIAFLAYLNTEYLLNDKQKKLMQEINALKERKLEEEKAKQYSADDIFKKTKLEEDKEEEIEQIQENSLVVYKESFFTKMINKIKNFFKGNKMNG